MISLRDFSLRRGARLLLSGVDLSLHAGWRIGVVGRNGCGKSSLFAALRGELAPDHGALELPADVRTASVAQETPALAESALDFVLGGDAAVARAVHAEAEATRAGDYAAAAVAHQRLDELNGYDAQARAGRLLHGLGFAPAVHAQAVAAFSGGWRARLNLARALMTPSDLLLLDEPTNHLDLDAVLWLEQWLVHYQGTPLVISHDREFLDGVSTHILHLHEGAARLYSGNYSAFERQRAEQLRQQRSAWDKQQAERAHLEAFIERFRAKATKARQAQSRIKRLARLEGTEAVRAEHPLHLQFAEPGKLPHSLIRLREVDAGYGAQRVLEDVDFGLEAGDRVALLGPNGAGKSTLVKTLLGELALLDGERTAHPDLKVGYFAQHTVESLRAGASPFDHMRELAPNAAAQKLRDFLGRWDFPGDQALASVDSFSGGERARLAMALIAWRKPNVLLLDEPTNHLDLEMREALAEALAEYSGAIVLVAHDRHLLGLVCDSFWRVAGGRVEPFDGDLDDYAAWMRAHAGEARARTETRKPSAESRSRTTGEQRAQRKRLAQLELRLDALRADTHALDARLAEPELYADANTARAAELSRQRAAVTEEMAQVEAEWLELYAVLEDTAA